eukprot:c27413_g2_i1 orf=743-3268(+)
MSSGQIANPRLLKVSKIFQQFDSNQDGGLDRDEMAALVIAVNPRVKFSDEQIDAILDEVFRSYTEFIDGDKGLSFEGLLRTYDDGAGDVDRDFDALGLELDSGDGTGGESDRDMGGRRIAGSSTKLAVSSITDERPEVSTTSRRKQDAPAWATSPHNGIAYEDTWRLVEDLLILIKRLEMKLDNRNKQKDGKKGRLDMNAADFSMDSSWSRELGYGGSGVEKGRRAWEELGLDYLFFQREVADIRQKADASRTQEEAYDAHMAIGRTLFDYGLYKESLANFKRATELKPTDVRPHFRCGNTLYSLGRYSEAKEAYTLALDAAEISGNQWTSLIPQIHVNLGITLEAEGMLLCASEHYKEAAIREPKHYRALKLLGSALYGVGEYRAAEKALEEAIFLKLDYADAHCDLGSTLHALGDDERAIQEFQKAIDLRPEHMDALYNLGGLFKDSGRYQRAAEMYSKVLALRPDHWRAQLNKAVALLGAGEVEEARKAFKEAFKMTNRVELYDAILHLKHMEKKPRGLSSVIKKAEENPVTIRGSFRDEGALIVEASSFRRVTLKTTPRQWLSSALNIRVFQRQTRLNRCDVSNVKKELTETSLPLSSSGGALAEKSIRKEELEKVLWRLLQFLKPETFQGAVKAINEKVIRILDGTGSGRVDLGMFFAIMSPLCSGPLDKRKRTVFDCLVWRSSKNIGAEISKADASHYIRLLHSIYLPLQGGSGMAEIHGDEDTSNISFPEFVEMFDDPDWGFGILSVVAKLEIGDRVRHGGQTCAVCSYPIIGSRFKEITLNFSLCSLCYSEGKVPANAKLQQYFFKEYNSEAEAVKDRLQFFKSKSSSPLPDI